MILSNRARPGETSDTSHHWAQNCQKTDINVNDSIKKPRGENTNRTLFIILHNYISKP